MVIGFKETRSRNGSILCPKARIKLPMCGNPTQRRRPALFSRDQFRSWPFIAHSRMVSAWLTSCLVPPWANLMPSSARLRSVYGAGGRLMLSAIRQRALVTCSQQSRRPRAPGPSMTTASPLFIKSYYLKSQVPLR